MTQNMNNTQRPFDAEAIAARVCRSVAFSTNNEDQWKKAIAAALQSQHDAHEAEVRELPAPERLDRFDLKAQEIAGHYEALKRALQADHVAYVAAALRAQAASTREKVEKEIAGWLRLGAPGVLEDTGEDRDGLLADAVHSGAYRQDKPKEE